MVGGEYGRATEIMDFMAMEPLGLGCCLTLGTLHNSKSPSCLICNVGVVKISYFTGFCED